jgi:hypothetical protein
VLRRSDQQVPLFALSHRRGWQGIVRRTPFPLFVAFCVLIWPIAISMALESPILVKTVYAEGSRDHSESPTMFELTPLGYQRGLQAASAEGGPEFQFVFDLRIVVLIQALAAVTTIIAWFTLNSVLTLYGH